MLVVNKYVLHNKRYHLLPVCAVGGCCCSELALNRITPVLSQFQLTPQQQQQHSSYYCITPCFLVCIFTTIIIVI